jgi:hypothetical protein
LRHGADNNNNACGQAWSVEFVARRSSRVPNLEECRQPNARQRKALDVRLGRKKLLVQIGPENFEDTAPWGETPCCWSSGVVVRAGLVARRQTLFTWCSPGQGGRVQ